MSTICGAPSFFDPPEFLHFSNVETLSKQRMPAIEPGLNSPYQQGIHYENFDDTDSFNRFLA
jgi:hypothetical protein